MKQFTVNTSPLKVFVRNSHLMNDASFNGVTEGYLIAVSSLPSRPLLFHVHLSTGALFSRLSIGAILCNKYVPHIDLTDPKNVPPELTPSLSQAYATDEGDCQYIEFAHFKDYRTICRVGTEERRGRYLFTLDYAGSGFVDDPEQYKTHNLIALDDCRLVALPNNYLLFVDDYFAVEKSFPKYKRQTNYIFHP